MANDSFKIKKSLNIEPKSGTSGIDTAGDVGVDSADGNQLKYYTSAVKTIADTSTAQTLTNKTLTSPAITTPTGIVKGDVGLGNVDNTSDATKNAASATLTNKTIDGDDNTVSDLAITALKTNITDASKFMVRDASGIPTSATKAVPTGVVVGTTDSQTLTNKSLTAPVLTGAVDASASTDVDIATTGTASTVDIGTGSGANVINVGGANSTVNFVGAVFNQGVTNLNVTDKLITVNDGGSVSSGGASGVEVEENAVATAYVKTSADRNSWEIKAPNTNGVVSVTPGASNDVATLNAASQTLTNKTLTSQVIDEGIDFVEDDSITSPSSGRRRLQVKTDGKMYLKNSSGTEVEVGSGNGVGINYFTNSGGETDASGGTAYQDAAATSPVDGTGGSPTVSWTRTTSAPLRGTGSLLFTKDAANRQGEGIGLPITIDVADKGKVLQFSTDFAIASGTYADDDLSWWVYDITNSTLIQPTPYKLKNHTLAAEKFAFEFQTSSSSTSYRVILHVASASALAYTVKFDNMVVGPQAKLYGSPVTDWVSWTPTGSWSTNTTYTGKYRRVGDQLEAEVYISLAGAPTATTLTVNLPSGLSIDTTKLPATTRTPIGTAMYYDTSVGANGQAYGPVVYSSTTAVAPQYLLDDNAGLGFIYFGGVDDSNDPIPFASGDEIHFSFRVPISGWSSSVVMSSDADTRVVAEGMTLAGAQTINTGVTATVLLDTKIHSTHGGVNTGSNRIDIKVPGYYRVMGQMALGSGASAGRITGSIRKNGTTTLSQILGAGNASGNDSVLTMCDGLFIAGDYLELRCNNETGANSVVQANSTDTFLYASMMSGPAQIAASEIVEAHYSTAAGQSIETGTTGEILNFGTMTTDSHGSVTTGASWKFTAPKASTYSVKALASLASGGSWNAGEYMFLQLYKNGSAVQQLGVSFQQATHTTNAICGGSTEIKLITGDYIQLYVAQNSGGTIALQADAGQNYVSIISR